MNVLALTEYTASMMNVSMGKANRLKINFNVRVILPQHNFWIMGTDICSSTPLENPCGWICATTFGCFFTFLKPFFLLISL